MVLAALLRPRRSAGTIFRVTTRRGSRGSAVTDMSGFDLIRKIKDKSPNARIIVLSSHEGDVDIQRALEAGAQGYVAKESFAANYWKPSAAFTRGSGGFLRGSQKLAEHMADEPISARELEVCRSWPESETKKSPASSRSRKTP